MRMLVIALVLFAAIVCVHGAMQKNVVAQQQQDRQATKKQKETPRDEVLLKQFMRAKLGAGNQVMEGLVTENFKLIKQGAEKLEQMSAAEEWRASNDVMYRQYSAEFQRIAGKLKAAAQDENLDAAALMWVQTTMSCIECHKFVRNVLVVDAP